jgi:hypothetical protein
MWPILKLPKPRIIRIASAWSGIRSGWRTLYSPLHLLDDQFGIREQFDVGGTAIHRQGKRLEKARVFGDVVGGAPDDARGSPRVHARPHP